MIPPPRDGWPAIEAALRRDRETARGFRLIGGGLAAAAAVALALGIAWWEPRAPGSEQPAQSPGLAEFSPPMGEAAVSEAPRPALERLVGLSQGLEARLRLIRAETGDLPADSLVYRVELEDLVVQVDQQLSYNPESLALWTQRVNLLMDLERLYENSLRRDAHRMASL